MTEHVTDALNTSRQHSPSDVAVPGILAAEETIASMPDSDVLELQAKISRTPSDGFLYLWLGLAARHRGQWQAAIDAFTDAIHHGCTHWRVGWHMAQAAKRAGQLQLVDQACAAVLKASPKFWFARELPKHARGYYSQIGQDKVIEQFFQRVAPRTRLFVEVGAFDGVHYSNVRRLHEKYGWTGISFEPVSKNFRKLCTAYAGSSVKCVQAAVSTSDGELDINVSTYPHLPDWGSDVATLGEADVTKWEREYGATWVQEKVPVRRLSRLLEEAGIPDFDFISIDTEGHDLEVLKSLDFTRYHPQLIVIEYGQNKTEIADLLQRAGYGVLQDNGIDLVACPKVLPRLPLSTQRPLERRTASKTEKVLERFFTRQSPRWKRMAVLGTNSAGFDYFRTVLAWTVVDPNTASGLETDLVAIQDPAESLAILQAIVFENRAPQAIAVAYGSRREQVLGLLGKQGYSPLADEDGVLAFARFQHCASSRELPATKNFTGLSGKPAYSEIEDEFQRNLHSWLGCASTDVQRIVIVGGCLGLEVRQFLDRYPQAEIHVFEPSGRHFPRLESSYADEPRVKCHRLAVSDHCGTSIFHEGSMRGTGSLLPPRNKAEADAWVPFEPQEKFEVQLTTLDAFAPLANAPIDLLWCDVQGAELKVLRGATRSLERCRAVFLEVANTKMTYEGQCSFAELDDYARKAGFYLAGIGLCPSGNGTGNAAWLRVPARGQSGVSGCDTGAAELRPIADDCLKQALARLQPHLLGIKYLPLERGILAGTLEPLDLLTPERFDLAIKFLYAQHRELGIESLWTRELYRAHIHAFSGGTCREGDGTKQNIEDYYHAFDQVLDDVKRRGFDPECSLVPIARGNVLIDGAHRVAACLLHRRRVSVLAFDREDDRFGYKYFANQGLGTRFMDAAALQYCRLRKDTFIVTVFPSAVGREPEICSLLSLHGRVVYAKQVQLNRRGARNLICEIYAGEPWLGDWRNNFSGANGKARPCFHGEGPVRVYLLQASSLECIRQLKASIRSVFGIGNHSVHINDTHAQAIQLAQLFFNENSINFLNNANPRYLERFVRHLDRYKKWLSAGNHDSEWFCIDGSAVLAAYGLRDAQDLDILHFSDADFRTVMPAVNSHNADAHHHTTTRDDIIFNPNNHFYAYGVKFASLDTIRRMKVKRNEGKDQKDVELIDQCIGQDQARGGRPSENAFRLEGAGVAGPVVGKKEKIVALIPARNEAARLPFCLRALKPYVDAIVYLDDCSDDDSVQVVESLAAECRVEHIIRKANWHRDEPGDRNVMLAAGRRIGGTHFIVLDADEAFTANCARDGYLRKLILSLRTGESLVLNWIQLWRSTKQYRFDASQWTYAVKAFVFCDDGQAAYKSGFIHTQRIPQGLTGRTVPVVNYVHGVMHFQFVNWTNLKIKQAWYRCMERVRQPQRSAAEINAQYAPSEDETNLILKDAPTEWFASDLMPDPATFSRPDARRVSEVLGWLHKFGVEFFTELDIWRVDWAASSTDSAFAEEIRKHQRKHEGAPAPLSSQARRHMLAASHCLSQRDLAGCRVAIESALAEAPNHPEIISALATLLLKMGNASEACERLEGLLADHPSHLRSWIQLATANIKLGNDQGAVVALHRALNVDRNNVEAWRLLAEYQAASGRSAEAIVAYRAVSQLAPQDAGVQAELARILVGTGDVNEARQAGERDTIANLPPVDSPQISSAAVKAT